MRPAILAFIIILSLGYTVVSAQDKSTFYPTQFGFSGGVVLPKLSNLNYITSAVPENGINFSGNLNHYFYKIGNKTRLYTGVRLYYFAFRITETNDTPYIVLNNFKDYHWENSIGQGLCNS